LQIRIHFNESYLNMHTTLTTKSSRKDAYQGMKLVSEATE